MFQHFRDISAERTKTKDDFVLDFTQVSLCRCCAAKVLSISSGTRLVISEKMERRYNTHEAVAIIMCSESQEDGSSSSSEDSESEAEEVWEANMDDEYQLDSNTDLSKDLSEDESGGEKQQWDVLHKREIFPRLPQTRRHSIMSQQPAIWSWEWHTKGPASHYCWQVIYCSKPWSWQTCMAAWWDMDTEKLGLLILTGDYQ